MADYFALLNVPRRPWLEPDSLRQKFLALASEAHPDRVHDLPESQKHVITERYAELNAAYNCLADSKLRLRHLLELELGAKPKDIEIIPPVLADWFAEVATACRNTDTFLAEKKRVSSPLLRIQLFERGQAWIEKLIDLQKKLNILQVKLTEDLKSLDGKWPDSKSESRLKILVSLENVYRLSGYFKRWNNQINERIFQLSV